MNLGTQGVRRAQEIEEGMKQHGSLKVSFTLFIRHGQRMLSCSYSR